jgi:heme oxygenase (mycobilin-producing)
MIVALSRFKVANGQEGSVAHAFLNRPRLPEQPEGFFGMEALADSTEPSIFYLSTRWSTELAFRQWYSSDAYRASHSGIPKGIKLDPACTQLVILKYLCD